MIHVAAHTHTHTHTHTHEQLCELEDQRNQLATETEELKTEVSESMNRSMSASMTAEHSSQELDKLRHETQTLRRHLESSQRSVKETDGLQQELRIALDRNQRLEFDLRSVHDDLKEARAAVDSVGDVSAKMQEVRRQAVLQNQEMQRVMAAAMETAAQTENKLQHELLTAEQAQKTLADQAQRAATELKFLKQQLDSAQQQQEQVHLQNTDALKRMAESHVVSERLKNENATLVHRCDAQQHELALRDQDNGDVCVRVSVYVCLYTIYSVLCVLCIKYTYAYILLTLMPIYVYTVYICLNVYV